MTNKKHYRVRWSCAICDDVVYSDTREQHKMDFCRCGKTGVDLDIYLTRIGGNTKPKTWEVIKDENGTKDTTKRTRMRFKKDVSNGSTKSKL